MEHSAAILLAAGSGARMKGAVEDKILAPLRGRPVFAHSLAAFATARVTRWYVIVYRDAQQQAALKRIFGNSPVCDAPVTWVMGGQERPVSVRNALHALPDPVDFVFIHDCARPLVRPEALRMVADAVWQDGAACLAHRITDTVKRSPVPPGRRPRGRFKTLDRDRLWATETPQAFRRAWILPAYDEIGRLGRPVTDDAAALELASRHSLTLVENPYPNPKITRPADLAWAEFLLTHGAGA